MDYYKEVSKEQTAIIQQLVYGPGEIEYIHPYDVAEMINSMPVSELISGENSIIDVWKTSTKNSSVTELIAHGRKYKQSTYIPAQIKSTKLGLLNRVISDIRELKQIIASKDVGALVEIKIHFIGDDRPTPVKISSVLPDEGGTIGN